MITKIITITIKDWDAFKASYQERFHFDAEQDLDEQTVNKVASIVNRPYVKGTRDIEGKKAIIDKDMVTVTVKEQE